MIVTHVYVDSNSPKDMLLELCNDAVGDDNPGSANISPINWESNPASLMHKIYVQKVYDADNRGRYYCRLEDGEVMLGIGFNQWDQCSDICLSSTRLYLKRNKRMQGTGMRFGQRYADTLNLLHESSKAMGYKAALSTQNNYNLFLREYIHKRNTKSSHTDDIEDLYMCYDHPLKINYTKQWAFYNLYDETYGEELIKVLDANRFR